MIKRNLTKFQEAQLSFALSDKGNFEIALRVGSMKRRVSNQAINRCFDAFVREGILEPVEEEGLTHYEFTCKARDYIDTFNLQDAWKKFYNGGAK